MIIGNESASHRRGDDRQAQGLDEPAQAVGGHGPAYTLAEQHGGPPCREQCICNSFEIAVGHCRRAALAVTRLAMRYGEGMTGKYILVQVQVSSC